MRKVIYEDYSAKTFDRPEWNNELVDLKKHRHQIGVVLFTKWDRFSRNAGDAYQMINPLRKLGIEPQAVEQPLDTSISESKIMLAVYLATPEVENDRRALNVLYGMRRAKKEGRWMGPTPVGYANKITEGGRKYIAPKEPEAWIMKWAFQAMATGHYRVEQLYKEAKMKGSHCCRSHFWNLLRNPVCCSKIYLSAYKDKESLARLDQLYTDDDVKKKRRIVGSIFPEKLVFDGCRYRTARLNEAVRLIYKLDKDFSQNKNGQTEENSGLSTLVEGTCKVSNLLEDIQALRNKNILLKNMMGAPVNIPDN